MDEFEKKYGIVEDKKIKDFHKSRRMFCIHKNKLFVAEPNLEYSHAVWFEKEGWISKQKDELINEVIRGMVDYKGDIYFYRGYNFEIDKNVEKMFFAYLKELVEKLNLKPSSKIFGGLIIGNDKKILCNFLNQKILYFCFGFLDVQGTEYLNWRSSLT